MNDNLKQLPSSWDGFVSGLWRVKNNQRFPILGNSKHTLEITGAQCHYLPFVGKKSIITLGSIKFLSHVWKYIIASAHWGIIICPHFHINIFHKLIQQKLIKECLQ
jgi:hypothetical protein